MPFARCRIAARIHYAERGEARAGGLPVVLVHGAGASSSLWMMVLARIGRRVHTVAIDLPGHGPSEALAGDATATIERYRDAVGELGAALGLGRAIVVGHSMGALVAVETALAWPEKVGGLVLCGAGARLPVGEDLLEVVRTDYPRFPAWLAERALGRDAAPSVRRGFVAAGVVTPQQVTLADFLACAGADLGHRLGALRCRAIWLDGADDRMVPATPDRPGEVRTLAGVGHLIPLEAPGAVADAATLLAGRPA